MKKIHAASIPEVAFRDLPWKETSGVLALADRVQAAAQGIATPNRGSGEWHPGRRSFA